MKKFTFIFILVAVLMLGPAVMAEETPIYLFDYGYYDLWTPVVEYQLVETPIVVYNQTSCQEKLEKVTIKDEKTGEEYYYYQEAKPVTNVVVPACKQVVELKPVPCKPVKQEIKPCRPSYCGKFDVVQAIVKEKDGQNLLSFDYGRTFWNFNRPGTGYYYGWEFDLNSPCYTYPRFWRSLYTPIIPVIVN